jgi:hypothetical protein
MPQVPTRRSGYCLFMAARMVITRAGGNVGTALLRRLTLVGSESRGS